MILGTGIDIIEIERIQKAIDRFGDHFLKHVFLDEEIQYAQKQKFPAQHFAARFAAKEAVFKAVGSDPHLTWKDIKVIHDQHGKPCCSVSPDKCDKTIFISLSHTKNYAIASAIITQ